MRGLAGGVLCSLISAFAFIIIVEMSSVIQIILGCGTRLQPPGFIISPLFWLIFTYESLTYFFLPCVLGGGLLSFIAYKYGALKYESGKLVKWFGVLVGCIVAPVGLITTLQDSSGMGMVKWINCEFWVELSLYLILEIKLYSWLGQKLYSLIEVDSKLLSNP